jgi:hypothetical protein
MRVEALSVKNSRILACHTPIFSGGSHASQPPTSIRPAGMPNAEATSHPHEGRHEAVLPHLQGTGGERRSGSKR